MLGCHWLLGPSWRGATMSGSPFRAQIRHPGSNGRWCRGVYILRPFPLGFFGPFLAYWGSHFLPVNIQPRPSASSPTQTTIIHFLPPTYSLSQINGAHSPSVLCLIHSFTRPPTHSRERSRRRSYPSYKKKSPTPAVLVSSL